MKRLSALAVLASLTAAPAFADVCVAPGDVVITDPAGDVAFLDAVPFPSNPLADVLDVLSLSIATPPADSMDSQTVVFTITANGDNPLGFPPGSGYFSSFEDPRKLIRGVRGVGDNSGAITYFSYVASESNGGFIDGRFVEAGSEVPAEGSYADGVMTITVLAKNIGVRNTGDVLSGFNVASTAFIGASGAGAADAPDGAPDDLLARATATPIVFSPCPKSREAKDADLKGSSLLAGSMHLLALLPLLLAGLRRKAH